MRPVFKSSRFIRSNIRALISQLAPVSFPSRQAVFRALAGVDGVVRECRGSAEAATVLDRSKADIYGLFRQRFTHVEAQALTLKVLNLWLSRHHFRARDTTVLSHPFGIIVDPSNMCQLACPGCVHSERSESMNLFEWPSGTLSESNFASLLRLYGPAAIAVYFCDYGEPLLNLNTPKLIRAAKSYLLGTALSTSLSVRRFDPEAYVSSGLDFMVLSIDGATQRVYERFRRNGKLQLVLENVAKLVDAKRKLGKRTPVLSWNFLAFEHNSHEIPLAERMARRLGVNQFRVVNPFDVSWDDPDIRPAAVKGYIKRLDWTSVSSAPENWNPFPEAVEANTIAAAFEKSLSQGTVGEAAKSPGHTCHWLYKNMVMDATGRILPCCGASDSKLVFGTLDGCRTAPFNSEKYRQARAFFAGDSRIPDDSLQCSRCDWDQTSVSIGDRAIRHYFRAADPWFFDKRSVRLLLEW